MKTLLAVALLSLVAGTALASPAEDESAIRKIIAEQTAAWNAGDGLAYAKHVAPEASFTNLFGMVMYGADAFGKRHSAILTTFYKGTVKIMNIRKLRFVTPDVAIVDIDNEIQGVKTLPAGIPVPANGVLKTQLMQVFVRHGAEWQVEAYHNVDLKESAATQK